MQSGPTGATADLVEMLNIDMGTAKVDHATCLRDRGENCTLCIDVCPVANAEGLQAITISPLTGKVIERQNICIGCGLCENRCPTEPQRHHHHPPRPARRPNHRLTVLKPVVPQTVGKHKSPPPCPSLCILCALCGSVVSNLTANGGAPSASPLHPPGALYSPSRLRDFEFRPVQSAHCDRLCIKLP